MNRSEWQRVKALFEQALERPEDARGAFLSDVCRETPALRRAVESLLVNHAAARTFMEQAPALAKGDSVRAPSVPLEAIGGPQIRAIGAAHAVNAQALDLSSLLHRRLISLTLIWLVAFGLFYAGRFGRLDLTPEVVRGTMLPGAAFLLFMAVNAALLRRRRDYTVRALRVFEGVVFGGVTLFLLNETYDTLFVAGWVITYAERHPAEMSILSRQTSILWLVHIIAYGTFIPNTGRRSAVVTGVMAGGAVATVVVCGIVYDVPRSALFLYLAEMIMWLGVAVSMAVYGSQKITTLREQALAARTLGQYQLKHELGRGGMGEVYLAEHVLLRRPCAVKIIRREQAGDTRVLQRFLREVQAASTLTHPNTIQVFDYGQAADGTMFYAMEYLTGPTLEELVAREGPLPAGRTVYILRQLCGALTEAHGIGLIHRDIKPSNVILCSRGGLHDVAKLLDFGLVRMQSLDIGNARLTQAGYLFGTPAYMAPEQAAGEATIDARSDIYGMGALACFLLTGEPPFVRPSVAQTLAAQIESPMEPLRTRVAGLPVDVEAVVLRCLAKHPADRYATAADLDAALGACCASAEWNQAAATAWAERSSSVAASAVESAPTAAG
jgi:serine/threonine-protein kinase